MKYLVVVDMQNDFINGSLGTPEATSIVCHVCEKVKTFEGVVLYTRDTHESNYLGTQEGKRLPVEHCLKGTIGWALCDDIENCRTSDIVFDKNTFGSTKLAEYLQTASDVDSVEFVGVCTDICVISNALLLKAYCPEVKIIVDGSCCAGVTPESHENALAAMKMCQIEVV